jgi:hypothetical protein
LERRLLMFGLFRALTDRLKALFVTSVGLDFEAELFARHAERQAELLRQAQRYQDEGLTGIAQHLRQQAQALSLERPLAGVLPASAHLRSAPGTETPGARAQLQVPEADNGGEPTPLLPGPKKPRRQR